MYDDLKQNIEFSIGAEIPTIQERDIDIRVKALAMKYGYSSEYKFYYKLLSDFVHPTFIYVMGDSWRPLQDEHEKRLSEQDLAFREAFSEACLFVITEFSKHSEDIADSFSARFIKNNNPREAL